MSSYGTSSTDQEIDALLRAEPPAEGAMVWRVYGEP